MASTTLMTFLLCTSPHVRSVKLLGSWDNFSRPYAMERDKRVGPGHWRGCHTFIKITCDGAQMVPARSGGLKMGGTYWYYYLIDDDIEYHNDAEPVTTHCPFLPGQPVNILQVPIILPDTLPTHTRARSPSSHRTERTMNPEDKYMNPRQPPKPKLRLRTSPPLLQQPTPPWSFSTSPLGVIANRGASQPCNGVPKVRLHRTQDKPARSVSPPRSRGFRAALRQWSSSSPNSPTGDQEGNVARLVADAHFLNIYQPVQEDRLHVRSHSNESFCRSSTKNAPEFEGTQNHLPRRPVSAGPHESMSSMSLSIQERRALNSKFPGLSTPRNPLTVRTKQEWFVSSSGSDDSSQWRTIKKALSSPSSPFLAGPYDVPSTSEEAITPTPFTFMNKRLPTLPNSPSSVMEEALRDLDARERELDTEALGSHFSDFTETESVVSESPCERSHFSQWSTDSELISPESMTSSSTFNESQESPMPMPMATEFQDRLNANPSASSEIGDPNTPHLTVDSKPSPATLSGDSPRLDLPPPRLTITLSPSDLAIPGLGIHENGEELESNPKRHAAFFAGIESLVRSPDPSAIHLPQGVKVEKCFATKDDHARFSRNSFPGASATMQEMMDELSYLSNMIQSEAPSDF